jgi:hypothetical protein
MDPTARLGEGESENGSVVDIVADEVDGAVAYPHNLS